MYLHITENNIIPSSIYLFLQNNSFSRTKRRDLYSSLIHFLAQAGQYPKWFIDLSMLVVHFEIPFSKNGKNYIYLKKIISIFETFYVNLYGVYISNWSMKDTSPRVLAHSKRQVHLPAFTFCMQ